MRYWCISTSPENWEICKNNRVWGMDARYYVTLEKFLKAGDKAVVYTHGGNFVAVVKFVGRYYFENNQLGWTKQGRPCIFPYRIRIEIIRESEAEPPNIKFSTRVEPGTEKAVWDEPNFIDDISFIADKSQTWNQYLQVSIIRITEEDFNTISEAIGD